MAFDPELPQLGTRLTTADGDWQVREVMLLGRAPLHYAVRMRGPANSAGAGLRLSLVLSRAEYLMLQVKAKEFAASSRTASGRGRR